MGNNEKVVPRGPLSFVFAAAVFCVAGGAHAQQLEPGEWEFSTILSAPGMPRPTPTGYRTCITKEQARDPMRWGANPNQPADCRATTLKLGPDSVSWEMECPGSGLRGTGRARMGRGSMQSETQVGAGRSIELRTSTTGRRLGPCKS